MKKFKLESSKLWSSFRFVIVFCFCLWYPVGNCLIVRLVKCFILFVSFSNSFNVIKFENSFTCNMKFWESSYTNLLTHNLTVCWINFVQFSGLAIRIPKRIRWAIDSVNLVELNLSSTLCGLFVKSSACAFKHTLVLSRLYRRANTARVGWRKRFKSEISATKSRNNCVTPLIANFTIADAISKRRHYF